MSIDYEYLIDEIDDHLGYFTSDDFDRDAEISLRVPASWCDELKKLLSAAKENQK